MQTYALLLKFEQPMIKIGQTLDFDLRIKDYYNYIPKQFIEILNVWVFSNQSEVNMVESYLKNVITVNHRNEFSTNLRSLEKLKAISKEILLEESNEYQNLKNKYNGNTTQKKK